MNTFDTSLLREVEQLQERLAGLRASLYVVRPGCTCSEKRLCAYHAELNGYLYDASHALHVAASIVLRREG